jgi:hypothetical protein
MAGAIQLSEFVSLSKLLWFGLELLLALMIYTSHDSSSH